MKKLLHPYIFIPFPAFLARKEWGPSGPSGHERKSKDHLTGRLKCTLSTVTKLCLKSNFKALAERGEPPYIPGSSLKGMTRNILQILGEGCAGQQFADKKMDEVAERQNLKLDLGDLQPCTTESACLSCRLFGYSLKKPKDQKSDDEPFGWAGNARFFDSDPLKEWSSNQWVALNQGAFTVPDYPKARPTDHGPRHLPFYFPNGDGKPAGWKLYRHANNIREVDEHAGFGSPHCVRGNMKFEFSVEFESLAPEEYAVLRFALTLAHSCLTHKEDSAVDLFHKLGYGKGVGLGSCSIRIDNEEFESAERFLGLAGDVVQLPTCGLEKILNRPSFAAVREARSKQNAAYLLLYPQQSWFHNPKGTIAGFDKSLVEKPPKILAPPAETQQVVAAKKPGPLPPKVRMRVTSIKSSKISAETLELYNNKKYRCKVNVENWAKPVSANDEITVEVNRKSVDHDAQTFEGSSWTL
ncbi:MAG TPA: RAMP superfamily CRISPR-associated protein [Candidatus Angelobacter sp.]|nr:RAMP superfamily CRISPR-associated protein [Candidatus Angelobacter sp.]